MRLFCGLLRGLLKHKRLSGIACITALHGMKSPAPCATEEQHMLDVLTAARMPTGRYCDFVKNNIGTIMDINGAAGGLLSQDPPHAATVTAYMHGMHDDSDITDPASKWPDRHANPHGSAAEQAEAVAWANACTQFISVCRLARHQLAETQARVLEAATVAASTTSRDPAADKKLRENSKDTVRRLVKEATAIYNTPFNNVSTTDHATVAETHIAFRNNAISMGTLTGGRYGQHAAIIPDAKTLKATDEGTLAAVDHNPVVLTRNAGVLAVIRNVLESFVVAGAVDIDPAVSHLAGGYGKLYVGTPAERTVQFDLATAREAESQFIALSGFLGPKELSHTFASSFIERVNSWMQKGHSGCSAFAHVMNTAHFMAAATNPLLMLTADGRENVGGSSGSGSGGGPSDTPRTPVTPNTTTRKGVTRDASGEIVAVSADAFKRKLSYIDELERRAKVQKDARKSRAADAYYQNRDRDRNDRDRDRDRNNNGNNSGGRVTWGTPPRPGRP